MFLSKRSQERAESAKKLSMCLALLEKMQSELCDLKNEVKELREQPIKESDPDAMSESEIMNKWIMGEKGDGF